MPSGEEIQRKGEEGAHRAKRWLERTLRAKVQWVNPDRTAVKKLTYKWPGDNNTFSFDLGGTFIGQGDDADKTREGENFFAEVKNYSSASDQSSMFTDFWQNATWPEKKIRNSLTFFYGSPGLHLGLQNGTSCIHQKKSRKQS